MNLTEITTTDLVKNVSAAVKRASKGEKLAITCNGHRVAALVPLSSVGEENGNEVTGKTPERNGVHTGRGRKANRV